MQLPDEWTLPDITLGTILAMRYSNYDDDDDDADDMIKISMTMMMIITLGLSGYHARGLEAILGKCAARGNFIHSLS